MKKFFEITVVIAFILTACLVVYFVMQSSQAPKNDYSLPTSQVPALTATDAIAEEKIGKTTVDSEPKLLTYANEELGFSFAYPAEYGELRIQKVVSVDMPEEPKSTNYYFLDNSGIFSDLEIYVYADSYDSGTDSIKAPVCPTGTDFFKCTKKTNLKGSTYYEVNITNMAGDYVRYEFPISSVQSLVTRNLDLVDTITIK